GSHMGTAIEANSRMLKALIEIAKAIWKALWANSLLLEATSRGDTERMRQWAEEARKIYKEAEKIIDRADEIVEEAKKRHD
uniref:De novo designed homotetramer n=1 Tax=synthetic construct TaxID=32630 RepID=UPI0007F04AEB|nr:Chain A, De novo designed homotetramer [synthetic construct]5JQZ_B Chain B, De novo designed homotetramer [synthetic construct]